jgi:hypothetical protein
MLKSEFLYNNIIKKIKEILNLVYISLTLNYEYRLNLYLLIFLFICILSSIIIRCNILDLNIMSSSNLNLVLIKYLLIFFTSIYSIKLIFNLINRLIQSFKIIPEFIKWMKNDIKNIKLIITIYYIQNIFFMIISILILYNIFLKLNLFIENIYLYIIIFGILFSLIFIYYYPLKGFNLKNNNPYPISVYLLLFVFFIFYIFIIPLIIINVINSEKYLLFQERIIRKYCDENMMFMCEKGKYRLLSNSDKNPTNYKVDKMVENSQYVQQSNKLNMVEFSSNKKVFNTQQVIQSNETTNEKTPNTFDPNEEFFNNDLDDESILEMSIEDRNLLNKSIYLPYYNFRGDFNINYLFGDENFQYINRKSIETIKNYSEDNLNLNKYILVNNSIEKTYGKIYNDYLFDKKNISF